MTVQINITGLEPVAEAVNNLIKAMGVPGGITATYKDTAPSASEAPAPMRPAPVPVQPAPAPPHVPTTPVTYTPDSLAQAAMAIMDSGRQEALVNLLAQFGVQALPDLTPDRYGAFATALRGMGAPI